MGVSFQKTNYKYLMVIKEERKFLSTLAKNESEFRKKLIFNISRL